MRVIFVCQNEIKEFKEKMNFFRETPAVLEVSKVHAANHDPSTSEFYKRARALYSKHDQNILTEKQMCSYAVSDWVLVLSILTKVH